jgi:hypothetical protein
MAKEKPIEAFIFSLIAGILILILAITLGTTIIIKGIELKEKEKEMMMTMPIKLDEEVVMTMTIPLIPEGESLGDSFILCGILAYIYGILVIVGALLIYTGEMRKVRIGGVMVLTFSILSLFSASIGGALLGFILGLIGGILALTWKPKEVPIRPVTATPPPPS